MNKSESIIRLETMSDESLAQASRLREYHNAVVFGDMTVLEYRNALVKTLSDCNDDVLMHVAHSNH